MPSLYALSVSPLALRNSSRVLIWIMSRTHGQTDNILTPWAPVRAKNVWFAVSYMISSNIAAWINKVFYSLFFQMKAIIYSLFNYPHLVITGPKNLAPASKQQLQSPQPLRVLVLHDLFWSGDNIFRSYNRVLCSNITSMFQTISQTILFNYFPYLYEDKEFVWRKC